MKKVIIKPKFKIINDSDIKNKIQETINLIDKQEYNEDNLLTFKTINETSYFYKLYNEKNKELNNFFNKNNYAIPDKSNENMKWYYTFENLINNSKKCNNIRNSQKSLLLKNMLFKTCFFNTISEWFKFLNLVDDNDKYIEEQIKGIEEYFKNKSNNYDFDFSKITMVKWNKSLKELENIRSSLFKYRK